MTLIQTLLTPNYVMQVSDRRLTRGGKFHDGHFNKAVSWHGCMTAAFTGFAYTDCQETNPVSLWIADVLRWHYDTGSAIDALLIGATKIAFDLASCWEKRKLSIVLAGVPPGSGFAYLARISNFESGPDKFPRQKDHFMVDQHLMPVVGENLGYYVSGVSLKKNEMERVRAMLPQIVQSHGVNNVARFLVGVQRRVAARSGAVGLDAMVMVVPARPTAPLAVLTDTASDAVMDVNSNFSYVRAHSFSPQRIAPLMAGDGKVIQMMGWGDAAGNQGAKMRFLKLPEPGELG